MPNALTIFLSFFLLVVSPCFHRQLSSKHTAAAHRALVIALHLKPNHPKQNIKRNKRLNIAHKLVVSERVSECVLYLCPVLLVSSSQWNVSLKISLIQMLRIEQWLFFVCWQCIKSQCCDGGRIGFWKTALRLQFNFILIILMLFALFRFSFINVIHKM